MMQARIDKLEQIVDWAQNNDDILTALLTSSLVNPLAPVDDFSDLDIELIFKNNEPYVLENNWLGLFGKSIAVIEEDESRFEGLHAMKMVLYDDQVKVDFKLFSKHKFLAEVFRESLPEDWDIGYKILIDKEGLTKGLKPPTYQVSIIKKPSKEKFEHLLNDFWWDATYVAKCLARGDIFYAKFMSENVIRTEYLVPLIEWFIASENNWSVTTNKHGRLFNKYLPDHLWKRVNNTFSGSDIKENWRALFTMAYIVNELGANISEKLGYNYPVETKINVRKYLEDIYRRSIHFK